MKKISVILIALLLITGIAGAITYYLFSDNFNLMSHEILSKDEKYSMKVPILWKACPPTSDQGVLAAQSKDGSTFVNVSIDSKYLQNGETVEEYVYSYINRIAENSDNPLIQVLTVAPKQVQLGDKTGYYFELDTSAGNVMLHTWDFVYTSSNGYIHIDVAAKGDNQEKMKDISKGIMESFKIN